MILTHCDLFFADAAVSVEGNVERLLLLYIIEGDISQLLPCYLSILEVGGAYAHRCRSVVEFIGLTTLVITDLDSIHPESVTADVETVANCATPNVPENASTAQKQEVKEAEANSTESLKGKCLANVPGAVTSNQTLVRWLPGKSTIDELLAGSLTGCVQEPTSDTGARVCVTHLRAAPATWNGETVQIAGRTFEEALAFANLEWMHADEQEGLQLRIRGANKQSLVELILRVHNKVKSDSFKKTDLALSLLAEFPDTWQTPGYIKQGLEWLAEHVLPVADVEAVEGAAAADDATLPVSDAPHAHQAEAAAV
jgi:hypothetical protein